MNNSHSDFSSWNRKVYTRLYSPESQILRPVSKYEREMVKIRSDYIRKYSSGVTYDLGCGIGEYSRIASESSRSVIGYDFSEQYLKYAIENSEGCHNVKYVHANLNNLTLESNQADFIFSFSTLYYIENISFLLSNCTSALRDSGKILLDFGNRDSLLNVFYERNHDSEIARNLPISVREIRSLLDSFGLEIIEWRSFQILPYQGLSINSWFLYPLTSKLWLHIMQLKFRGIMLDEMFAYIFRRWAFRHLILAGKK